MKIIKFVEFPQKFFDRVFSGELKQYQTEAHENIEKACFNLQELLNLVIDKWYGWTTPKLYHMFIWWGGLNQAISRELQSGVFLKSYKAILKNHPEILKKMGLDKFNPPVCQICGEPADMESDGHFFCTEHETGFEEEKGEEE